MITTLVIVAVIAATAAFCSRLERSTLRKVLLVTTVSFVCWTPLLFVSGSYDCDVDCPPTETLVPWMWVVLGAAVLGELLAFLLASASRKWRTRRRSV